MNTRPLVRSNPAKRTVAQWLKSPPTPSLDAIALPLSARQDAIYRAISRKAEADSVTPIPAPAGLALPPL